MGCRGRFARGRYLFMSLLVLFCVLSCAGFLSLGIFMLRKRLAGGHRSVWGSYRYSTRLSTHEEDADANAEPQVAIEIGERQAAVARAENPSRTSRSTAGGGRLAEAAESDLADAYYSVDDSEKASPQLQMAGAVESGAAAESFSQFHVGGQLETSDRAAIGQQHAMNGTSDSQSGPTASDQQTTTKNDYITLKREATPTRFKPDGKKAVIIVHESP